MVGQRSLDETLLRTIGHVAIQPLEILSRNGDLDTTLRDDLFSLFGLDQAARVPLALASAVLTRSLLFVPPEKLPRRPGITSMVD